MMRYTKFVIHCGVMCVDFGMRVFVCAGGVRPLVWIGDTDLMSNTKRI